MSVVYRCDACGKTTTDPHYQEMKEFFLGDGYMTGSVMRKPVESKRTIHLCKKCFENLHSIGGKSKLSKTIKVKYLSDKIDKLEYVGGKSDWIDLRSAEDVEMKAGEFKLIPLGVAIQLPNGYEAHIVPRSSTYKNFKVIQTNHTGIVDETYCGDNDQWFFPAYAMEDTTIHTNDRICQFRIMEHQPTLFFEEVAKLGNKDRGGIGSTGKS